MTLSPGFTFFTSGPTSFTTPASSLPGENGNGGLNWYLFWMISTSGKFTLAACMVITMHAASVNFPDVLIIQNKYQFKPPLPFSPGSELAGVVKEVGPEVKNVKPGDKVIAFTTYGAFAEEVKTEAARLLPLPPGMDFVAGAAFLLTYGTSDHALRDRGALKSDETLLVLGAAGGVGPAAIEVGKGLRAAGIACGSSEEKLAVCKSHGAEAGINYA